MNEQLGYKLITECTYIPSLSFPLTPVTFIKYVLVSMYGMMGTEKLAAALKHVYLVYGLCPEYVDISRLISLSSNHSSGFVQESALHNTTYTTRGVKGFPIPS